MSWLRAWWDHFFFARSGPDNLSICRALFYGLLFLQYRNYEPGRWASIDDAFWMPIPLFAPLGYGAFPAAVLDAMGLVWKTSLALACLGFLTRASTMTAFVLGLVVIGLPQNYGKTHHNDAVIVLMLGVLAAARVGDAWSLDRLVAAKLGGGPGPPADGPEYTWPIRLAQILLMLVFFAAGVAKLRGSGLSWVFSANMANVLLIHHYTGHNPPTRLGLWIAARPAICWMLAGGSLVTELAAPLALFGRRPRLLIIPALFLMQFGIWLLLGVLFIEFLYVYVFWIPWDRLARSLGLGR